MASKALLGSKRAAPRGVERFRGSEMERYLKEHPTVLYRYQPNTPGFLFLLLLGSVAAGLGLSIWFVAGWASVWHGGALVTLLGTATALILLVGYWTYFARINWLATSDLHLLVGRGSRVLAIEWEVLNVDSLWFSGPGDDAVHGTLDIRIAEFRCRVRLYGGFAVLENLQSFISTLLSSVAEEE